MVGKSVVFTAEITNPGPQTVANVLLSQQADATLTVTQASDGATRKGNDLVWTLPSVLPGRSLRQVQCDCKQPSARACCRFTATLANGQSVEGQACLEIAPAASPTGPTPPSLAGRDPRASGRVCR